LRDAFPPHLDLQLSTVRHVGVSLSRFIHPLSRPSFCRNSIPTPSTYNNRSVPKRARYSSPAHHEISSLHPLRTVHGEGRNERDCGVAGAEIQGRHELDLSYRQETSSPRARNRSDSDVRVTSCQDPLRRLSCCGLHVANEGVANTWGIYIGNTFGLTSGMEFLDIFKVNLESNLSLFAKIPER